LRLRRAQRHQRWLGATALSTQFYYDVAGRLTNTTFADNYQINRAYDGHDLLKTVTDSGGRHLEIEYSQLGLRDVVSNVWMVSDSIGPRLLLANKFDEYGRVTNSVDRNGVTVSNKFDLLGRVLERRAVGPSGTPAAGLESFGYDLRGLAFYTNALGKRDIFVRDTAGRLIYQTNANNEVLQFTYDAADDLLTLTDGKLQTTTWHYDAYGRPTNKLDQAAVEILRYIYDPENRLTNRWSAAMGTTTYSWDNVGNLLTINYPSSGTVTYGYDGLSRLTNMVDSVGTTKFIWTAGDQLASEDGPWASDTVTNTYNNRFRSALSLQQPTGTWTNGFAFDEFARLTNVISPAGTSSYQYRDITLASGDHTACELVARLNLPNTSYITNNQDGLGRLLSTILKSSGDVALNSHEYSYNDGSQRTHQNFTSGSVDYFYDNIGQLTNADSSVSSEKRGYFYDAAWNLNRRTNNGVTTTFTVDSKNQLNRGVGNKPFTYDGNGNLINSNGTQRIYTYDDENRLIEWAAYAVNSAMPSLGDKLTDFVYDGLSRLRIRLDYHYIGSSESPSLSAM